MKLYDGNGNLQQRADGFSVTSNFTYDVLDRLDTASGPFGSGWNYDYDANGNRTLFDDGAPTGYTYEPASNRLDGIGSADVLLSVAGNTLAKGAGATPTRRATVWRAPASAVSPSRASATTAWVSAWSRTGPRAAAGASSMAWTGRCPRSWTPAAACWSSTCGSTGSFSPSIIRTPMATG